MNILINLYDESIDNEIKNKSNGFIYSKQLGHKSLFN